MRRFLLRAPGQRGACSSPGFTLGPSSRNAGAPSSQHLPRRFLTCSSQGPDPPALASPWDLLHISTSESPPRPLSSSTCTRMSPAQPQDEPRLRAGLTAPSWPRLGGNAPRGAPAGAQHQLQQAPHHTPAPRQCTGLSLPGMPFPTFLPAHRPPGLQPQLVEPARRVSWHFPPGPARAFAPLP